MSAEPGVLALVWQSVSACAFWSALTVSAVHADADAVLAQAREHLTASLLATARAADLAAAIDRFGAAALRAATGFPPHPDGDAVLALGRAQAAIAERWPAIRAAAAGLGREGGGREFSVADALRHQVVTAVDAARRALSTAGGRHAARDDEASRQRAAWVLAELSALSEATEHARSRVSRALLRTTFWTLAVDAAGALALTAAAATARSGLGRRRARAGGTKLPLDARPVALRPGEPDGPARRFADDLRLAGLPTPVAADIAAWLGRAPGIPGSLAGHDAGPDGLRAHTLETVRQMAAVLDRAAAGGAAAPSPRERALALTIAAAHDLGKTVAYHEDRYGVWAAHGAIPHDALSAIVLAHLPSTRAAFSPQEISDMLQALSAEHANDLPDNASPRVRRLLDWLRLADSCAARLGAPED